MARKSEQKHEIKTFQKMQKNIKQKQCNLTQLSIRCLAAR